MPYKDIDIRCSYIKEWKRKNRRKLGIKLREECGNNRPPRTEQEKEESKIKRKLWEQEWRREYFKTQPQKRLLWSAKRRAKEKGLPFNITEEDIIVPLCCPYLGIPLSFHSPRGSCRTNIATLDRIVPKLGYVKGNIEVISHLANTMKSNATPNQLLMFAKEIISRYEI